MEMPDVIYADDNVDNGGSYYVLPNTLNAVKYHHNRIKEQDDATIESLRRENEELKAKLDKAKGTLEFYATCQGKDGHIGYRARTTLEEIE